MKTKLERKYDVEPKRRKIADVGLIYTLAYLLTEGWSIYSQIDSERIEFVSFWRISQYCTKFRCLGLGIVQMRDFYTRGVHNDPTKSYKQKEPLLTSIRSLQLSRSSRTSLDTALCRSFHTYFSMYITPWSERTVVQTRAIPVSVSSYTHGQHPERWYVYLSCDFRSHELEKHRLF
jgi:hypothetical protein